MSTVLQAVDLSRFADDAEYEQDAPSERHSGLDAAAAVWNGQPVDEEAEALWEQQGGLDTYLAALESGGSGPSEGSDASEGSAETDDDSAAQGSSDKDILRRDAVVFHNESWSV